MKGNENIRRGINKSKRVASDLDSRCGLGYFFELRTYNRD
jgi:hypothetical protein